MPRPIETLLAVAVVVLLILSAFEFIQISSLQNDVNALPHGYPPDYGGQIFQLQQQISSLASLISSFNGKVTSFKVTQVCVSASHGCGGAVFSSTVSNNGTVPISLGDLNVNLGGANSSAPSQPLVSFDIGTPALSPGASYNASLTSFSGPVFNNSTEATANGTLPYRSGQTIPYYVIFVNVGKDESGWVKVIA